MNFAQIVTSAVNVLLVAIAIATPAHAQSNKPVISGTWYEDRATVSVANYYKAVLTFAQTPANKFLDVTHVTCGIAIKPTQILSDVSLFGGSTSGSADLGRSMTIRGNTTFEASSNYKFYSLVTDQVLYKFGPGRYPSIAIYTETTGSYYISGDCVIVGELKDN
jgi:hypothetical protein